MLLGGVCVPPAVGGVDLATLKVRKKPVVFGHGLVDGGHAATDTNLVWVLMVFNFSDGFISSSETVEKNYLNFIFGQVPLEQNYLNGVVPLFMVVRLLRSRFASVGFAVTGIRLVYLKRYSFRAVVTSINSHSNYYFGGFCCRISVTRITLFRKTTHIIFRGMSGLCFRYGGLISGLYFGSVRRGYDFRVRL